MNGYFCGVVVVVDGSMEAIGFVIFFLAVRFESFLLFG